MQPHLIQQTKGTVLSIPAVPSQNTSATRDEEPKNDEIPFADIVELLTAQPQNGLTETPAKFKTPTLEQEPPSVDDMNIDNIDVDDGTLIQRWPTDDSGPEASEKRAATEGIAQPESKKGPLTTIETEVVLTSTGLENPTHKSVSSSPRTPVEMLMMSQHQPKQGQPITPETLAVSKTNQNEATQLMPAIAGSPIARETTNSLPPTSFSTQLSQINPVASTQNSLSEGPSQTDLAGISIPKTPSALGETIPSMRQDQPRTPPPIQTSTQQKVAQTTLPPALVAPMKSIAEPLLEHANDGTEFRLEATLETKLTAHTTTPAPLNRTDSAAPITRQIIDAIHVQVTTKNVIEVSLNPAELGRLKLSLTPAENGLVINVLAERAESIELMRRNLYDLEQTFSDLGHENITFSFEQSSDFAGQDQSENSEPTTEDADWSAEISTSATIEKPQTRDRTVTSGIDIRI